MVPKKRGVVRGRLKRIKEMILLIYKYDVAGYFIKIPFSETLNNLKKLIGIEKEPVEVRVRLLFQDLGPVYVKMGQVMSLQYEYFPRKLCYELEKLQDEVPPFPSDVARKIIEKELGKSISELFAEFDDTPVASASLSQVHKAKLHSGEIVALKVQRPGIREVILQDFDLLSYFSKYFDKRIQSVIKIDVKRLIEDAKEVLVGELDFRHEVENIEKFYENNKNYNKVVVPKVYREFCSENVITMSFIDGVKISNLEKIKEMGLYAADVVRDFVYASYRHMFIHGFYHGDPHPANVLVLSDGRLGFIDLGSMGTLDKHMRDGYIEQTKAIAEGDSRTYVLAYANTHNTVLDKSTIDELEIKLDLMILDFFEDRYLTYGEFVFEVVKVMSEKVPLPQCVVVLTRSILATTSIMRSHNISNKETLKLFVLAHYNESENHRL